ncbi:MAG: hypothetical protein NXI24_02220 [bacterium]|nr:hypothetical protein [bacterium]
MRHPTRAAIDRFNSEFRLTEDPHMQDWEIECANPERVEEFTRYYVENNLDDDEKFTLMALILGSFEEYCESASPAEGLWRRIKNLLIQDHEIQKTHIVYYQCRESNDEAEFFSISKRMREIQH